MMVLTGWDTEQLGRQPAHVVRGLMHRVLVRAAWDPSEVADARSPLPDAPMSQEQHDAREAKAEARERLALVESLLFPEGD